LVQLFLAGMGGGQLRAQFHADALRPRRTGELSRHLFGLEQPKLILARNASPPGVVRGAP
jgi:hypothetical protein